MLGSITSKRRKEKKRKKNCVCKIICFWRASAVKTVFRGKCMCVLLLTRVISVVMDAFVSVTTGTLVWVVIVWTSTVVMAKRREDIIKGLLNESKYDNRIPPNYEDNFPTNVTIQIYVLSFDSVTEASMVTYEGSTSSEVSYGTPGSGSSSSPQPSTNQPPRFDYSVTIFLREHWEDSRLQWGRYKRNGFQQCHHHHRHHHNSSNNSNTNNNNNNNVKNAFNNDSSNNAFIDPTNDKKNDHSAALNKSQTWDEDEEILERLEVDSKLLEMVWMPDLYFVNDKEATIHDVTTANRMLHIYRNGTIRTSTRISMTLSCDMYLDRYPHDQQTCSMYLGSYSFSAENVLFHWHELPVIIRDGVTLPRFEVQLSETGECDFNFEQGSMITGNYTCIRADFRLTREFGYYVAQVYVPSCLIVSLSWVSFWIDLDAIPARVSLGLLTVLTMTTQSTGEKASLPRVSYVKAIDIWMAGCLVFVFGALLEFAYVNVQSRVEKRRRASTLPRQPRGHNDSGPPHSDSVRNGTSPGPSETEFKSVVEEKEVEVTVTTTASTKQQQQQQHVVKTRHLFKRDLAGRERARTADKVARVVFPFTFLLFNIVYWMVFVAAPF